MCDCCNASFTRISDYKHHVESQVCQKCKLCQSIMKASELSAHKCNIQPLPPVTYAIHVPVPKASINFPVSMDSGTLCHLCQTVFSDSSEYVSHLYENDFCFGCRLCPFLGSTKDSLISHVLNNHKNNLQVSVLDETKEITAENNLEVKIVPNSEICTQPVCGLCSQFVDTEEELRYSHKVLFSHGAIFISYISLIKCVCFRCS